MSLVTYCLTDSHFVHKRIKVHQNVAIIGMKLKIPIFLEKGVQPSSRTLSPRHVRRLAVDALGLLICHPPPVYEILGSPLHELCNAENNILFGFPVKPVPM